MASMSLWQAYQEHGDASAREQLIQENLRLVYHMAWKVMKSCPQEVEFDDLLSAGTIGLMNAIDNFDPERGLAFSTLAAPRIRGAILDDLRRRDTVPRSIRRRQRKVNQAREDLMQTLKRAPRAEETAEELGIEMEDYWKWSQQAEQSHQLSLDQPRNTAEEGQATMEEYTPDEGVEDLDETISQREEVQILKEEILNLKRQDRLVLSLYYFEGLKLHEIASVLGVTESRISQIRSKAIKDLRKRLGHLREEVLQ
jgi:RNA polymerase sigma factor for flagellar operon FliA